MFKFVKRSYLLTIVFVIVLIGISLGIHALQVNHAQIEAEEINTLSSSGIILQPGNIFTGNGVIIQYFGNGKLNINQVFDISLENEESIVLPEPQINGKKINIQRSSDTIKIFLK